LEGVDVSEEEILQALVEEELHPEGATVREGEEESGEAAAGATQGDLAEVGPIGLSLLTGETVEAEESLAVEGTELGHDAAQLHDAAGVATLTNHLVKTSGAQAGMTLESLAQEVAVGIGETVAQRRLTTEAMGFQGGAHGVGMQTEFSGDGADLPVLDVKVATNGGFQLGGNQASPP
jgi:hypothetical protein